MVKPKKSKPTIVKPENGLKILSQILEAFKKELIDVQSKLENVFSKFDPTYAGFDEAKESHERAARHFAEAIECLTKKIADADGNKKQAEFYSLVFTDSHQTLESSREGATTLCKAHMIIPANMVRFCEYALNNIGIEAKPIKGNQDLGFAKLGAVTEEKLWNTYDSVEYGTKRTMVTAIF